MEKHLEDQKDLYNKKADDYLLSHGSKSNDAYRDMAYRQRILDISVKDKTLLDAMCGPGIDTGFLNSIGANVIGLDLSDTCAKLYEESWKQKCHVASIHETGLQSNSVDIIFLSGGLHHIIPQLDDAMIEIHRILRPEGYFCFIEPNADTFINYIRKIWYKIDNRFGDDEGALSYKRQLKPFINSLNFEEDIYFEGGNLAYLLILQSGILNIPEKYKLKILKPSLFTERLLNKIPFFPKLFFAARWKKK
jgi:SAM-dependent methyltransferase